MPAGVTRVVLSTALVTGMAAVAGIAGPAALVTPAAATPTIAVTTVVDGLDTPWDLTWVGDLMLYNVRGGQIYSRRGSTTRLVSVPLPPVFATGEAGLLGMVADPRAASTKRFYTCQAVRNTDRSAKDLEVLRWRLTSDAAAVSDGPPLITGIPLSADGRHSGCRLRFGADGYLYVGTGDATIGTAPQDKASLGGKILRVAADGTVPADNPYATRRDLGRFLWSYGHRNVQGLALRPGTKQLWSTEQGTDRNDEINQVLRAGNYGWNPVPGYDESRPMTDTRKYPKAVRATWSSGNPTVATSGLTFLTGSAWGRWEGALAVGMLKEQGIKLVFLNPLRKAAGTTTVPGLAAYSRIRTVQTGPDGALWFTTSNGSKSDVIGRIAPTATPPAVPAGTNIATSGVGAARSGSNIYVFVRSSTDAVLFKHSANNGKSWSGWRNPGFTTSAPPSVASSASGRIEVLSRLQNGQLLYSRFSGTRLTDQINLQGNSVVGTLSSAARNRLDVFALTANGSIARRQFDGTSWGAWRNLGGTFTSAVGASVNTTTGTTLLTARGRTGEIYERTVTATGDGSGWVRRSGRLWSGRALGDTRTGVALVGAARSSDGFLTVQRGELFQGLPVAFTSDVDVVTRSDGSWLVFGRGAGGHLYRYGSRAGEQKVLSLGGSLR